MRHRYIELESNTTREREKEKERERVRDSRKGYKKNKKDKTAIGRIE